MVGAIFIYYFMLKVSSKDLLKHRAKHRKKSKERVYIIFWVNFRTGEIMDSLTHSNLKEDKFLSNKTNLHCEDFILI